MLSVVLAAAMLASCTQYRVIWIPGMDDQNTPSTSQSAKDTFSLIDALDEQLPGHIESVMKGESVPGLTRTDIVGTTSMASRSGEDTYSATFAFNEYPVAGYGTIKTGTLTVTFTGTKTADSSGESFSATTSKMDFNNLSVLKTNETAATPVEIKNLEGSSTAVIKTDISGEVTVEGLAGSMSIKQSISSSTTITVDNVNIPAKDVADSNTSGDFASGLGTKDFPYVIRSEEQFANIRNYSEEMKNGAYYYFSIESDLDYSTGNANPHLLHFRGELDFNDHVLAGLSFTRLKELNGGVTANNLIEMCYGGAIKNLSYQPVGQCNLIYGLISDDKSPSGTTEFLFENVIAGNKDNPQRFDVGGNGGSFISQVKGPAKLTMRNCTNYCNIDVISSGYAGIFVSGYGFNSAEFVFENCDNHGTMYGLNLGFLIGNDTGIDKNGYTSITANDCNNYGKIYATNSCGFVGWDDTKYKAVYHDLGGNTEGTITPLDKINATASTDENETIAISDLDTSKYSSYEIVATGYGTLKSFDGSGGTLRIIVSTGRIGVSDSSSFKKLSFIDKAHAGSDIATDAYGNEIATVNGVEYYSIDLASRGNELYEVVFDDPSYTLSSITYRLLAYDSAGNLAGSMDLNI